MNMNNAVIVSAQRSAIGAFGKTLASVSPRQLGKQVLTASLNKMHIEYKDVQKVILGNVLCAGQGQNIARQVTVDSGLSLDTPAFCVNQVCASGLQSVILAAQSIQLGECDLVVAGGVESMSQAAYALPKERWGAHMGHGTIIDTMVSDGLWDAFEDYHMGQTAENIAKQWNISRKEQDTFALFSQQKAARAQEQGAFADEIIPISIAQRKGDPIIFDKDEYLRRDATMGSLAKLRPAFIADGTVTAGNASGINDGVAIVILSSEGYAEQHGLEIMARLCAYNSVGLSPDIMGYGPVESIMRMSEKHALDLNSIDRFEINEAFASQSIAVMRGLNIDGEKVNKQGGAIALGHPIGASGVRILCTLLHGMRRNNERKGIASLCAGGGMGVSVYVEC